MSLILTQRHGFNARRGGSPVPDLLWWKLNEGSGTTLTDSSTGGAGGGTHDADYVTGKSGSGYALDFNGTSDDGATSAAITYNTDTITVAFWINRDSTTGVRMILESSNNLNNAESGFGIYIDGSKIAVGFRTLPGGQYRNENISAPAAGEWHHVALVLKRNYNNGSTYGDIVFYVDGTEVASTVTLNAITTTSNWSNQVLYVGARNRASFWYSGLLDDVRIYTGDRSADIAAIMNDPQ